MQATDTRQKSGSVGISQVKTQSWLRVAASFYRNPTALVSVLALSVLAIIVLLGDVATTHEYYQIDILHRLEGSSGAHWLGTDEQGRDIFSRLVIGARTTVSLAVASVSLAVITATLVGVVPAVVSPRADTIVQRIVEVIQSFPALVLLIFVVSVFGKAFATLCIVLGIMLVASNTRVVRAVTLGVLAMPFIEASRSTGASSSRIVVRHILPNITPTLIVLASINVGSVVLIESSLSFLGFGPPPPTPSWGRMLNESQAQMQYHPYLAVYPGLAIGLTVFSCNMLGDWLRDVLDPRMRGA